MGTGIPSSFIYRLLILDFSSPSFNWEASDRRRCLESFCPWNRESHYDIPTPCIEAACLDATNEFFWSLWAD